MTSTNELRNSFRDFLNGNKDVKLPAFMGNIAGVVLSDDRFNVYITLMSGEVITVRNNRVPNVSRLPVIVGYDEGLLQVLRSRDVFDKGSPYPELPSHSDVSHTWPGYDTTWVRGEQFYPGLALPSSGYVIQFMGFVYYMTGWRLIENQTLDLSGEIAASGANYILVEVDASGVIAYRAGATVASRELLEFSDIPSPLSTKRPLFAVKTYLGQASISHSDIVDLRWSGYASGSASVNWADLIDVPATFPPDLTITDQHYAHKWYKSAPPTVNDDGVAGYSKSDVWIDQSNGTAFICISSATGAADWLQVAAGAADLMFQIEGRLAVISSAAQPILITKNTTVSAVYVYCENLGTAGSTIIDIYQNDPCLTSIFSPLCDNRPELFYNDANGWVKVVPTVTDFAEGDVLFLSIDQIATGAGNMVVMLESVSGGGGGGTGLTVTDGVTTVNNVGQITTPALTDEGGGQITIYPIPNIPSIGNVAPSISRTTTSASYADISSAEFDLAITKIAAGTDVLIVIHISMLSTAANTGLTLAVAEAGTDYEVTRFDINTANAHISFSAIVRIAGLSAGAHTFRPRWLRRVGAGTITMNTDDRVSMSLQEVQ